VKCAAAGGGTSALGKGDQERIGQMSSEAIVRRGEYPGFFFKSLVGVVWLGRVRNLSGQIGHRQWIRGIRFKGDQGGKSGPNFTLFDPVKIRGGMGENEMSECDF